MADTVLLPSLGGSSLALACAAAAALLATQARRVAKARALLARAPAPYGRRREQPARRVLLVGDSTGAGVGCRTARESIAARLAGEFADAEVRNLCFNGATVGDVLRVVRGLPTGRFDLVLVFAGGNDVLRHTPAAALEATARELLRELGARCDGVLWAGIANVGLAPLFLPPFSWWMSARTRRTNRLLARLVHEAGGGFADFFRERGRCRFAAEPALYYAEDGVHPSARAYAWCYARMRPAIAAALRG